MPYILKFCMASCGICTYPKEEMNIWSNKNKINKTFLSFVFIKFSLKQSFLRTFCLRSNDRVFDAIAEYQKAAAVTVSMRSVSISICCWLLRVESRWSHWDLSAGLWIRIRIRIGSVFNGKRGSGSGSVI